MKPNPDFRNLSPEFWANVRLISQSVGYTAKRKKSDTGQSGPGPIKVPTLREIAGALSKLGLTSSRVMTDKDKPTPLGTFLVNYFDFRAKVLNDEVERLLMNVKQAEAEFKRLRSTRPNSVAVKMNKQSNEKRRPAYFSVMIQMLIEDALGGLPCNYDPQVLTTVTRDNTPFRTLSRRIDGTFPRPINPIAVWEIKEYYHTTTFGSRVADGVYETLLDGMELLELQRSLDELAEAKSPSNKIQHVLMVDAYDTWWKLGRSYLCRIIDMLHMGYVDEVLFGREIFTRLPAIAKDWAATYRKIHPGIPVTK
jgi:hypothetical protein